MVSPEALTKKLAVAFAELSERSIDLSAHSDRAFDIAFDIVTIETGIAGIADSVLSGGQITDQHKHLLRRSVLDGVLLDGGQQHDLSETPDLRKHLELVDEVRRLCLQVLAAS